MRNIGSKHYDDVREWVSHFPKEVFAQTDISSNPLFFIYCFSENPCGKDKGAGNKTYPFRAVLQKGAPNRESVDLSEYQTSFTDYEDADFALSAGMTFLTTEIPRVAAGLEVIAENNYLLLRGRQVPKSDGRVSPERARVYFEEMRASIA